jgi:hypothetical protein
LPNICGSIGGTHIPLVDLPSKKVTHAHNYIYEKKKSIIFFYKGCVVEISGFEMCVLDNQEEFMMVASLRFITCKNNYKTKRFCKNMFLQLEV